MTKTPQSSETIHASCVAIDGRAVLLSGISGAGKSDLALRLLDRGWELVSDDYTLLRREDDRVLASAPPTITGKIEVRGVGLVERRAIPEAPVALWLALDHPVERMPTEPLPGRTILGLEIPSLAFNALEPSAPIKLELALRHLLDSQRSR